MSGGEKKGEKGEGEVDSLSKIIGKAAPQSLHRRFRTREYFSRQSKVMRE